MSDETTLKVGVEADASDAVRDMKAAATAASELGDAFREIATVAVNAAKALNKVEQGVTGNTRSQKASADATKEATTSLKGQANAANELATALANASKAGTGIRVPALSTPGTGTRRSSVALPTGRSDIGVGVDKASRESLNASNFAREQSIKIMARQQQAIREVVLANIAESKAWRESNSAMTNKGNSAADVASRMQNYVYASKGAAQSTTELRDSLFTARFALNDISRGTALAGASLIAFNVLAVQAAADYESAMAQIDRTTGATVDQMKIIRSQFVELAQTIPGGFANLGQIGELAGQLNVPSQRIASFTETVAQFVSSTDVAVGSAAESFGRLDALLPDVQGNYEALGSSILNVGVNSVATESAIISTTTQIAAAGAQARFTADEVIGLAASYASLGIAPEAARGSTIRIFSELRTAALEGGESLDTFAKLAGKSAGEFQDAWLNGDSSTVFLDFLRGLQAEGSAAETTLRDLGITGVRDINALLRLSQNVDVVTDSFGYANDGFAEGTQLAEAFGITSNTLNSKLELLVQSFQAMFAELGAGSTGPLKNFVVALTELVNLITTNAPAVQFAATFVGLFTIIAGGLLLITAFVSRVGGMAIAVRTTRIELASMQAQMIATNGSLTRMQTAAFGAAGALTKFSTVAKGLAYGALITVGLTALLAGIEAIGNASRSSAEKAEAAFGDLSGLSSALRKDTEELTDANGDIVGAYGTVEGKLTTVTNKAADWVTQVEQATGAQTNLAREADLVSETVDTQTFAIGENTRAWLANQLASNDAVVDFVKAQQGLSNLGAPTIDTKGVIAAAVSNDTEEALRIVTEYQAKVDALIAAGAGKDTNSPAIIAAKQNLEDLKSILGIVGDTLDTAAAKVQVNDTVFGALGVSVNTAGGELDEFGDSAITAVDKLQGIRDAVETAFGGYNVLTDFGNAARELFQGIADGGTAFDALGEAGGANLANLQTAIVTTIAAGETLGVSAVDSVSALFLALQAQGVSTANLLASLASIPGIGSGGVKQIQASLNGQRQMNTGGQQLADTFNRIASTSKKASAGIGGGGGGGGGGVGGAAKKAAQEIRTLVDYANDLSGVFARAFDIRFGTQSGIDKITSGWMKLREEVTEANKAIAESQRKMNELTADTNVLTYFKSIADAYGDSLRSETIQVDIDGNNAEFAEEQAKAAEESEKLNKGLTGNTKASIENRDAMTGLISNYQSLIQEYAEAGLDQAALTAKTAELKAEFLAQAAQLGYNSAELETYAVAFDDVTLAIQRVPRNITVSANTNPALQALAEFEARATKAAQNASNAVRTGAGGGYTPSVTFPDYYNFGQSAALRWKTGWNATTSTFQTRDATTGNWVNTHAMRILKTGGYTGDVGTSQVAGIVHGKEYVINAQNTSRLGLGFLNSLNSGKSPAVAVPSGGNGIQVVELSARDRALLAAAGNVTLSIDGRTVAEASNSANFVSTKRGTN